jgi:DNA-binding winged helix-turn-helix (wHTH) protein
MNKNIIRYIGILVFFIGIGTLYAFLGRDNTAVLKQNSTQSIHLALRRTANLLLKQAGDSTSTIAPIQQTSETTYLVKLEHTFNYDSLPIFLQRSFDGQGITNKYDVAVLDCRSAVLILGYSSFDFLQNKEVPCGGRAQTKGCLNFSVTFDTPSVFALNSWKMVAFYGSLLFSVIAVFAYFFYNHFKKKAIVSPSITPIPVQKTDETYIIHIGQTVFDTQNQILLIQNIEQKLTFQEAQLLQLFCQHRNELLERDFILKTVWGDEGVLITRSVDVFVSRLRQLLKADTSLKIVNVYNRGYRFETHDNQ